MQPLNIIDVAAVAPFYVNLFIDGEEIGAAFRTATVLRVEASRCIACVPSALKHRQVSKHAGRIGLLFKIYRSFRI